MGGQSKRPKAATDILQSLDTLSNKSDIVSISLEDKVNDDEENDAEAVDTIVEHVETNQKRRQ